MPVVYLSGRFAGRTIGEVRAERRRVAQLLEEHSIEWYDPLRGAEDVPDDLPITSQSVGMSFGARVSRDLWDLNHSDVVLVLTGDQPSWGTAFEAAYAIFVRRIPVVVVGNPAAENWLNHFATAVLPTVESAVEFIHQNFGYPAWTVSGRSYVS